MIMEPTRPLVSGPVLPSLIIRTEAERLVARIEGFAWAVSSRRSMSCSDFMFAFKPWSYRHCQPRAGVHTDCTDFAEFLEVRSAQRLEGGSVWNKGHFTSVFFVSGLVWAEALESRACEPGK